VEKLMENPTVIAVNVAETQPETGGPVTRSISCRSYKEKEMSDKKLGHRRVKNGEVTFKKSRNSSLDDLGMYRLAISHPPSPFPQAS